MNTVYIRFVFLAGSLTAFASHSPGGLIDTLVIPGEMSDLSTDGVGANHNRLGGTSDLLYDRARNVYYSLADGGPGGGLLPYLARMQQFTLDVEPHTGAISDFQLQKTILFKTADGTDTYNGQLPGLLSGDRSNLGLSFDPEGLALAVNGNFFVSDETGPSLYEFTPVAVGNTIEARFVRAFDTPDNLRPVDALGMINYDAERKSTPALVSGHQEKRGFEGLAVTPDGQTLFAVVQAPLAQEGPNNQGRRGRNTRIVRFDVTTGQSTGQFIYPLEDIASINARIGDESASFSTTDQGRSIGVSSLMALSDHELLAMERDDRGIGVDNPANTDPVLSAVGTKRIYRIDLNGATDASTVSLAGTGDLPAGVIPVSKSLFLDLQAQLSAAGLPIPDEFEGLTFGPSVNDGRLPVLLIGTDNDYSVRWTDEGVQLDVYNDGTDGPVDGDRLGRALLPWRIYSFALPLFAGDADMDMDFDQLDLVRVQVAGKYLSGQPATWGEGDWDGAPGGYPGNPPLGDALFDQHDIVAALRADIYLTGPYTAWASLRREAQHVGVASVPEPIGVLLLGVGVACLAAYRRRFRGPCVALCGFLPSQRKCLPRKEVSMVLRPLVMAVATAALIASPVGCQRGSNGVPPEARDARSVPPPESATTATQRRCCACPGLCRIEKLP